MNMANEHRSVLLGYDGSPASTKAMGWAVREAELRQVPLEVCHAWHWPYPFRDPDDQALHIVRAMGAIVADEGADRAREMSPKVKVSARLVRGPAPAALLAAARHAAVIVIGARGAGGFDGLPVGSAAMQVPAHTDRPVVVVPPESSPPRRDGIEIVVGVDGSPAGEAALRFALTEAGLRDLPVTAVCGWWDPAALPGPEHAPFTDLDMIKGRVRARFESAVDRGRAAHPGTVVETRFVMRQPQLALADLARGASLLVVGDRGGGSAPQALLGAVTRTMLHEAPCPIAIVHEESARNEDLS